MVSEQFGVVEESPIRIPLRQVDENIIEPGDDRRHGFNIVADVQEKGLCSPLPPFIYLVELVDECRNTQIHFYRHWRGHSVLPSSFLAAQHRLYLLLTFLNRGGGTVRRWGAWARACGRVRPVCGIAPGCR